MAMSAKLAATSTAFFLVVTSRNTNISKAARPARVKDDFHVGGVLRRRSRASTLACCLRSEGLGGRPVRPRASMVPAALPRCFERRFRFVCAMAVSGAYPLPEPARWSAAPPPEGRRETRQTPPRARERRARLPPAQHGGRSPAREWPAAWPGDPPR